MSDRLTLEQLRREQCYLALSAQQQKLVEVFLETGSKLQAVKSAYACKSEQSAKVMTYAVFAKPNIVACLNLHFGKSHRDVLLEEVIENIRHAERGSGAMQKLLAQKERLLGGEPGSASEDEPQEFAIGDEIVSVRSEHPVRPANEYEAEAARMSDQDNPHGMHIAFIHRDDLCSLVVWRQAGKMGNYWDDIKEQQYQTALQTEREYFATNALAELLTYPIKVGRQWEAATLALAVSELQLGLRT